MQATSAAESAIEEATSEAASAIAAATSVGGSALSEATAAAASVESEVTKEAASVNDSAFSFPSFSSRCPPPSFLSHRRRHLPFRSTPPAHLLTFPLLLTARPPP